MWQIQILYHILIQYIYQPGEDLTFNLQPKSLQIDRCYFNSISGSVSQTLTTSENFLSLTLSCMLPVSECDDDVLFKQSVMLMNLLRDSAPVKVCANLSSHTPFFSPPLCSPDIIKCSHSQGSVHCPVESGSMLTCFKVTADIFMHACPVI